jgi:L-lactate utilization protein LutC
MQWSKQGAHLLLQTRTRTLNGTLRDLFTSWYPAMAANNNEIALPTAARSSPTLCHAPMTKDEAIGVGFARWAIAETGSLVFHSGPDTPILFNFLPLHHVVAVRAGTILPHLEDYAEAAAQTSAPRNAGLVTGASGTTDIEGSYVRGAHGPRFLHVVVVTS